MKKLDTTYTIETPEGVELELIPAGPLIRSGAWLLDALIRGGIYFVLALTLGILFSDSGTGIFLIILFLGEWFYPVIFELTWGATPGKRSQNLLVVQTNGTPVTWQASLIRNFLRTIDFLPMMYAFGLICTLMNKRFQRIGDLAAGTLVIYKPEHKTLDEIPNHTTIRPNTTFEPKQQQALINYAERLPRLSEERAEELANHLSPITQTTGRKAVDTLIGYAQWLIKGRS